MDIFQHFVVNHSVGEIEVISLYIKQKNSSYTKEITVQYLVHMDLNKKI